MDMEIQKQWDSVKNKYRLGDSISGTVLKIFPYGVFLDINEDKILGFIRIVNLANRPDETPSLKIGDNLDGIVVDLHPYQVSVSIRESNIS